MPEFSGLQIDPRCIKCGRPPTADIPLYEMRNHLSICEKCRQEEEQKGKQIAWADDRQMPLSKQSSLQTRTLTKTEALPKSSLFGMLGLATSASSEDVEKGISEKMRLLMREPDSDEKAQAIERLRNWQEELIINPAFLQAQRDALQPSVRSKSRGGELLLGTQTIASAQELLAACEGSEESWKQAELLLREGKLEYWIHFQVGNRIVANEAGRLAKERIPTFRVLNILLYLLVGERPYRFYNQEKWQPLTVLSASTPAELALLCDRYWELGEHHLYQGAMIAWLEHSHGCKGLGHYYSAGIQAYEKDHVNRGLGLELVLERSVPRLTHPKFVVTFNGERDEYILENWDREIRHQPVVVDVNNTTRGFTSVALKIINTTPKPSIMEPNWIYLPDAHPSTILNAPGPVSPYPPLSTPSYPPLPTSYGRPVVPSAPAKIDAVNLYGRAGRTSETSKKIVLANLEFLKRGKSYQRTLQVIERREYDQPPVIHEYPLVIKTMSYYQGFRGILWCWGLRGDLPGFLWSALIGGILAFISSKILILSIQPVVYAHWYFLASNSLSFSSLLLPLVGARIEIAEQNTYVVATALVAGILGLFVGFKKGHSSYTDKKGAQSFRKGTLFLTILLFAVLLYPLGYKFLGNALQYGEPDNINNVLLFDGGQIVVCVLVMLMIQIVVLMRVLAEKYLRKRYSMLLEPEGRE